MIAYQCISILSKHGAVVVRHDFHFPDRWKYSSSAAFTANVTLPYGVVRVQEHAAWSACYDYPRFRQRVFPRLQDRETRRRFPEVSKAFVNFL